MVANTDDAESLDRFMASAAERFGGSDVLVNAVGRIDAANAVRLAETEPQACDVRGTFLACRAALSYLRRSQRAAIVNFARSYGNGTDQENLVNSVSVFFCAAKCAIRGFTAALARRIRVNRASPGMIEANWDADWNLPQEHLDEAIETTPLRRLGLPDEIAQSVASPGGRYTKGQILQVDGSWLLPGRNT